MQVIYMPGKEKININNLMINNSEYILIDRIVEYPDHSMRIDNIEILIYANYVELKVNQYSGTLLKDKEENVLGEELARGYYKEIPYIIYIDGYLMASVCVNDTIYIGRLYENSEYYKDDYMC